MKVLISILLISTLCFAQNTDSAPLSIPSNSSITLDVKSFDPVAFFFSFYVSSNLMYHIPHLPQCVFNIENLPTQVSDFITAVIDGFTKENPKEISDAILALAGDISSDVLNCGDTFVDAKNVINYARSQFGNWTFLELAVERIGANLPKVYQDVLDIYHGIIVSPNATLAGSSLGDILQIFFDIQKSYPKTEVNFLSLKGINWPFTNCGESSDLLVASSVNLDSQPSKGIPQVITITGNMYDHVVIEKVQITTSINGNVLNTQYDTYSKEFQKGDPVNYRFAITIPGFAPSGHYGINFTFQDSTGKGYGCVGVAFDLYEDN